jgi:hypothetical protein
MGGGPVQILPATQPASVGWGGGESYRFEDLLPDTACHPACQYWVKGGGESYRLEDLLDLVGGGGLGEGCDIDDHPSRHLDNGFMLIFNSFRAVDYNK